MASFLFRVDASVLVGTGHLARCATLAEACAVAGHRVAFLVGADAGLVERWIGGRGWEIVQREGPPNGEEDFAQTAAHAARHGSVVVVDGYDFYGGLLDALVAEGIAVCAVDDLYQLATPSFAVLNHNLYGDASRYGAMGEAGRVLAGPSFALVRDEFLAARASRLPTSTNARRVLVTMGGSDPVGATPAVLAGLEALTWSGGLAIEIVVGPANPQLEAIQRAAGQSRHRVEVLPGTDRMGALLSAADLVITAGGTTCMEIACVGVPALVLIIADNQRLVHDAMSSSSLAIGLGWHADLQTSALADTVGGLLGHASRREEMAQRQRAVVDGRGKHRVVAALSA